MNVPEVIHPVSFESIAKLKYLETNFTVSLCISISLFQRAFQFTICNGPTNALVCNKTLIQMTHTKTLKITPTCFDHQLNIIRALLILVKITG
jgi:hypothetical protein